MLTNVKTRHTCEHKHTHIVCARTHTRIVCAHTHDTHHPNNRTYKILEEGSCLRAGRDAPSGEDSDSGLWRPCI